MMDNQMYPVLELPSNLGFNSDAPKAGSRPATCTLTCSHSLVCPTARRLSRLRCADASACRACHRAPSSDSVERGDTVYAGCSTQFPRGSAAPGSRRIGAAAPDAAAPLGKHRGRGASAK